MLVSIIMPLYNCSTFLESTIRSIIAQSYIDWELILVDDCSQDNSLDIANDYVEQDSRIKLIKLTKNSGAAVARNKAIWLAHGYKCKLAKRCV